MVGLVRGFFAQLLIEGMELLVEVSEDNDQVAKKWFGS